MLPTDVDPLDDECTVRLSKLVLNTMSLTRTGSGGMGGEIREALAPINDVGGAIDD